MKTLLTDIQRFCLTDGDGIRTTVFFKGCNMHCSWCHNPETLSFDKQLMFYPNSCIGCGKCLEVCPNHAHKVKDGAHIIDRTLCTNCGTCADVCYAQALRMCGREMSVAQIMEELVQDIPYYKNSGGGVTLSGGEVLCNSEFAAELAQACRDAGIQVAIETNLSLPLSHAKKLLDCVDFVMCDLKLADDAAHKHYTGISNTVVMENMKLLDSYGIPFIVRTPLIPGVTDTKENIQAISKFISQFANLRRYELLNFNPLGEGKYKGLDMENTFAQQRPLEAEQLNELRHCAEAAGIPVKVM